MFSKTPDYFGNVPRVVAKRGIASLVYIMNDYFVSDKNLRLPSKNAQNTAIMNMRPKAYS